MGTLRKRQVFFITRKSIVEYIKKIDSNSIVNDRNHCFRF